MVTGNFDKLDDSLFVDGLRTSLIEVTKTFVAPDQRVAHVGYPDHWNAGDPAIWLGTQAILNQLGANIVYKCSLHDYDNKIMDQVIDNDTVIIISGGGNLGDIWPRHQIFREKIITDFPKNKIVQFPQSVSFQEKENIKRFKSVVKNHDDLHFLIRDKTSLRLFEKMFDVSVTLAPDAAYGLGNFENLELPSYDMIGLIRSDKESSIYDLDGLSVIQFQEDWIKFKKEDEVYINNARRISKEIRSILSAIKLRGDYRVTPEYNRLLDAYDDLALIRLKRGLNILCKGNMVVTDRLHGHILCTLLNISNIILDNNYQKLSSFYNTWSYKSEKTHYAKSVEELFSLISV